MSGYFKGEHKEEKIEQLAAFNKQYEAFNKKLLRGSDIVSVINKALDNNKIYGPNGYDEPNYRIDIVFEMKEAVVYTKGDKSTSSFRINYPYSQTEFNNIKTDTEAFTDFKRRIFDCVEVKYHETTGRINYMKFVERKLSQNEYETGL